MYTPYKNPPEDTQALWASAEHWLENWQPSRAQKDFKLGCRVCPCCTLQTKRAEISGIDCFASPGCPIAMYTAFDSCEKTPYYEVNKLIPETVELEYRFLVCLALGEDPLHDSVVGPFLLKLQIQEELETPDD